MSSNDEREAYGREFDALHAAAQGSAKSGGEIAGNFVARLFGAVSEQPVYLSTLPNEKNQVGEPGERRIMTRETGAIAQFVKRWDRPRRALYFCVATVQADAARRAKETLAEIILLHADVDYKSIDLPPAEIMRKLEQLRLLPTIVIHSGHGLHLYWLLREAIIATPETIARVEDVLKLLCDHVGGDPSVCECSRLMRLPGSHNSKTDEWRDVTVLTDRPNLRFEVDEIEEWLAEVSPLIRRRNDAPVEANPWLAVAAQFGMKPPIDVEQRLAGMRYQGERDASIHSTQVSVTAALLMRGHLPDDVVATVLAATRVAAGPHGERWNWTREERAVRAMCATWLAKHPEIKEREPAEEPVAQATGTDNSAAAPVISLAEERTQRQQKIKSSKTRTAGTSGPNAAPIAIAQGVIDIVRNDGGDLMLTGGDLFIYREGVWRPATGADEQSLKCHIQRGAETLGEGAKLSIVGAAWKRLTEHPDLHRETVEWGRRDLICVENGVLDLHTRKFMEWSPAHYLRRKLAVAYDPARDCPQFIEFMQFLFTDREAAEREEIVALLQEFFGACLGIAMLNREARRALLLKGPSRTGKTALASIIRALIGEPIASPAIREIAERFGAATFYGACAWIRDDAVNEGDRINPERFKTLISGEPIDIERKNHQPLRHVCLDIPVVLTCNSLPTSRDSSDAIFNRSLVVELTSVIDEDAALEARKRHRVPTGKKIGPWLFELEGPGILNWALDGLARLLARGQFDIPQAVRDAIQTFKDDSNPVAEWARTILTRSDTSKIERGDLLCAFHGWWREEMGDDVRLLGGRWFIPKLKPACPWMKDTNTKGTRYLTGIKLNAEGLKFWKRQNTDANQRGQGSRGTSTAVDFVNKTWSATDGVDDGGHDD